MQHWSDIFPLIFFPFKIIVLAIGAYFAIKWHYDEDNRIRKQEKERAARGVEQAGEPGGAKAE